MRDSVIVFIGSMIGSLAAGVTVVNAFTIAAIAVILIEVIMMMVNKCEK